MSHNVREPTLGHMHLTEMQLSLRIHAVWSKSWLSAFWIAKDPKFLYADKGDSDQIARMRSDLSLCWAHMSEATFPHAFSRLLGQLIYLPYFS